MASLRRKLRVFATTWLVFQAVWVAALVPRDCCAAHRPAERTCHESAAAAQCPMRAADGTPCPMHRGRKGHEQDHLVQAEHHHQPVAAEHHREIPVTPADCRLGGVCDGPMAALFALLSHHGILPEPTAAPPNVDIRLAAPPVHENVAGRFEPPDPPPPRA